MSRTQEIRDALAGGAMTFAELHAKLGWEEKKLRGLVGYAVKLGEVRGMGSGPNRSLALANGSAAGTKQAKAVKKRGKAKRGRKAARPYKKLTEILARAGNGHDVTSREARVAQLALSTFAALKCSIAFDADDPEDALPIAALTAHEQALGLLGA